MVKTGLVKSAFLKTASAVFLAVALSCGSAAGASGVSPNLLDPASIECLKCHEGIGEESGHAGGAHTAGVEYAGSSSPKAKLKSASALKPELKLIAGRLSCTTCHVPYSKAVHAAPERGAMLVMGNEKSALCTACHDI